MQVLDITEMYVEGVLKANNPESYFAVFPELFDHYFSYWAEKGHFQSTLTEVEVKERASRVRAALPVTEEKLKGAGLQADETEVALFVGQGTTNGHAFLHDGKFLVWLPVEAYEDDLNTDVFVTHEIIHALHYAASPSYYFHTGEEKENTLRQLVTEGLATYASREVLGISIETALWGSYLSTDDAVSWVGRCKEEKEELWAFAKQAIKNGERTQLFMANDASDVRTYRAGYWLGLSLVERYQKEHALTLPELLRVPMGEFERVLKENV